MERAAESCRETAKLRNGFLFSDLVAWLEKEQGIQTRLMPINVMGSMLRQFDFHRNRILLSEAMPEEQRLFQLCSQVALVISQPQLDTIISESGIDNIEAKNLLKMTLSNYFAGCLMMPYDSFLNAAIESKYDLEQLTNRFSASFEQICHRLTTLNKPNARGIEFFFLELMRLDISQRGFLVVGLNLHDMEAPVQGGFPIKHLGLQAKSNTNLQS